VTTGGIKRLKEHLVGGYADTTMCSQTTTEIRKEMKAYLDKNKRNRPIFIDDDDNDDRQQQQRGRGQEQQDSEEVEVVHPSSGTAAKRRRATFQYRTAGQPSKTPTSTAKEVGKVATMLRRTPEQVVDDRRSSSAHQTTIEASIKSKADRDM
jgi:hypothetical protein